ncbi:unnamed protein product, partial [Amoebophrya sp. A25]
QVLSWLKDRDQDIVGLGGGIPTLLRRRDAPLAEREGKALEQRLGEICAGHGNVSSPTKNGVVLEATFKNVG